MIQAISYRPPTSRDSGRSVGHGWLARPRRQAYSALFPPPPPSADKSDGLRKIAPAPALAELPLACYSCFLVCLASSCFPLYYSPLSSYAPSPLALPHSGDSPGRVLPSSYQPAAGLGTGPQRTSRSGGLAPDRAARCGNRVRAAVVARPPPRQSTPGKRRLPSIGAARRKKRRSTQTGCPHLLFSCH